MKLPNFSVTFISILLSLCSSIQNGYISSVLNVPQDVLEGFVSASYESETGVKLTAVKEAFLWSGIVTQRQVGQFIGTLASPILTHFLGRKGTILLNTLFLCSGLLLQFLSNFVYTWELLIVGRLIWGTGCGVVAVVIPMFISEISPNEFRGALASLHGMFIGLGSLLADILGFREVLGTAFAWQYEYLIMIVLQVIQILTFLFYGRESPKDLYIRQGKTEEAIEAIKFYQNASEDHVAQVVQEYEQETALGSGGIKIWEFLRDKKFRMSVLVGVGSTGCYAFGGMQIITTYSTEILMHLNASKWFASRISLGIGALRFFAVFPSMYIVERFGRRKLLLGSVWGCIASFLAIAACFFLHGHWPKYDFINHRVCAFCMLFYGAAFSIGCQTIATFLPSELVPTRYRSANQSFSIMFRFIIAFMTTFSFLPLLRASGWVAWLVLLVPLLITAIFMQRYMPETKNRTIQEILVQMNAQFAKKLDLESELTPLLSEKTDLASPSSSKTVN